MRKILLLLMMSVTLLPTATADVASDVNKVQTLSSYTAPSGYADKGYVGRIISQIFDTAGKIQNQFIVGLTTIHSNYPNNIPKWDGNKFVEGTLYNSGGLIGVGTSTPIRTLDVNGDIKGNNLYIEADHTQEGITGVNYNITGVNALKINDPGEGIIFHDAASIYVHDDDQDDKIKINGKIVSDHRGNTYDTWIQGGVDNGGNDRNLALLGKDNDSGDTLYVNYAGEYTGGTVIGGSDENSLGIGTAQVAGDYGSVQTLGSGKGGYEGFSINGKAVFMNNGAGSTGIYNDNNNEWLFYGLHNADTRMYYDGTWKIRTQSYGGQILGLDSGRGDTTLRLTSDTDNSGENDNPLVILTQDDGAIDARFGIVGDAGEIFTGSRGNATYVSSDLNSATALQLVTNGTARMTVLGGGNIGIGTNSPTQKLDVVGKIRMRTQTASGDSDDTVATKKYVDDNIYGGTLYVCPNIQGGSTGHSGCHTSCNGQLSTVSTCQNGTQNGGRCNYSDEACTEL